MKCLVTGATGFVGRALCERLNDDGVDVIATSRSGGILSSGVTVHALDLESGEVLPEWLASVDAVIHLAGIAHQDATASAYEAVNYRATLDLAAAAKSAGVKSFIFLSSVKAMGSPVGFDPRTEGQCVPVTDPYGHSKRQAELDLRSTYENSDMSVIVLRPALIYGAGALGNIQLLAKAVRARIPRPPERGGRSMIALDDLTELLSLLLREPPGGFQLWIVCDGRSYSASKIYVLMQIALGRDRSKIWLPLWVWRSICGMRDMLGNKPLGTTYSKIFGFETYLNTHLLASTNWRPALTFEDAVEPIMGTKGVAS